MPSTTRRPRATIVSVMLLAVASAGCATGLFGDSKEGRKQAIRECTQQVPADAVPYADAFSTCMEQHGYVYTGASGPRR